MTEQVPTKESLPPPPIEKKEWSGEFWRAASVAAQKELEDGTARGWSEDVVLVDGPRGYFALCDGMGGQGGGAKAAELAAQTLNGEPTYAQLRDDSPDGFLRKQFDAARLTILSARTGELSRMDTTATVLYVGQLENDERYAVIGHVGDCRAYLIMPTGEVHQLTQEDDYLSFPEGIRATFGTTVPGNLDEQRDVIRKEMAEATDVDELNVRALGLYLKRNITCGVASARMQPHVTAVRFAPGCRIALMSDGVYENIRPERIESMLRSSTVMIPQQQAEVLIREAQGGTRKRPLVTAKRDDKTVLIIESAS